MSYEFVSVVLPAYRQVGHIEGVIRRYNEQLELLPIASELLIVVNGPLMVRLSSVDGLNMHYKGSASPEERAGWGNAVRYGLGRLEAISFASPTLLVRALRRFR